MTRGGSADEDTGLVCYRSRSASLVRERTACNALNVAGQNAVCICACNLRHSGILMG